MKKLMSVLLAVCLLAVLAFPTMAAKVDLGTMAQDAINDLAKYNSTEVGAAFNVKTIMGYVFGGLCADDTYFVEDATGRYEWYKIPGAVFETKMQASFANTQSLLAAMQSGMTVKDFTFEYGGKVADQDLKVYNEGAYWFNKYNLERTVISESLGIKKESKAGYVVENPYTFTVNGYAKAGGYKYDVYATRNDGAIVKYTIEWAGGDVKFISTASASAVPAGVTAPGTQADLETTTTAKPTTTTTTKKSTTTTTTATTTNGGNNGTTTTTGTTATTQEGDTTTEAVDSVTTTTAVSDGTGDAVQQTPDEDTAAPEESAGNSNIYVIIGVVLGVIVLGVIAAIVIVVIKMKKPAPKLDGDMQSDDVQE